MTKTSVYMLVALSLIVILSSEVLAHEKVVVVPLSSSKAVNVMQGQGRPGVELISHPTITGYCTGPTGVKYALPESLVGWGSATSVCPTDTWVCSLSELPISGSCNVPNDQYSDYINCDGSVSSSSTNVLAGWLSDRYTVTLGAVRYSSAFDFISAWVPCYSLRVWCCWK